MAGICKHKIFICQCQVTRLADVEESDNINGYMVDLTVKCKDCGQDFQFIGVPIGYSPLKPMMSASGIELRIPITPKKDINSEFFG